jgi:hypothetical protein
MVRPLLVQLDWPESRAEQPVDNAGQMFGSTVDATGDGGYNRRVSDQGSRSRLMIAKF